MIFLLGKITFFTLVFVIPVLFHPMWVVLLYYGATSVLLGIVLSVVFQLAHTVEQAEFPLPGEAPGALRMLGPSIRLRPPSISAVTAAWRLGCLGG